MAWRCRGTLLAALLAAGLVAVSHAQLQSANVVNSSAIVVTLSASSVIAGDCSSSFNYTTSDGTLKPTSGASFVNCTATDATTLTLFYASGVSFASGDKINLRVNQTAVRNGTNTTALLPMAAAVAVQPVLLSAKLTTASTLVVDLPLSSTFSPANVSVCNSALVLQTPGAATAKADSFTACTASSSTQLTLTLAAGKYQPGDGVQVVFNQSVLVVGTTGYAPSKSPVVASPVILTASLTSSTGVALSLPTAGWLPAGANASVCNSVFVIRNGTVVTANALSACVIAPDGLAALLTLANSTYYGAGVTVNLNTNQTSFRAGTATGPLFLPATSNVAINPTIVSAALTGTSTVVVTLPVVSVLSGGGSTLATADCATTFAIKSPGASVSKAAFTACNLASNGLSITLTLAAGAAYTAGDSIDVASSSGALLVGTTPYTPRAQPVVMRPTLLGATYWNASALQINLPTASALASPFTPADCNSVFILRSGNATTGTVKPNAFSACSISGTTTIYATLATGTIIAPGDTIDVADGQWKLRAGSISTGPAYIPTAASISAGLGLATLTNATTVVVSLPAASTGISSLADCTAALAIYAADTTAKSSAISACSIAADGKSITVTLASATTYAPGDYIDVVASQTKLRVNSTTNSTMYYVPDTSTIDPQLSAFSTAAAAVLTSETSLLVTLPTASRLAFTPSTNGSDCNAAFELRSGTTAKTNPFTACSLLASSTSLSLTLAAGAYTAGDTFNVKPGNALLAAGTPSANALYVPGTAISIGPQLVSAAISNVTVFVKLPFVSSLAATFDCNATILLIPSGSTTPKTNPFVACSLSSDSKALILTLASASTYASGDMLQVKANQTTFLAGSTAYVPGTAITIMVPAISSAIITSATNVVATLNVDVAMTGTSADDCNNAFGLYASTSATTAKAGPPFLSCVVGTNKRTVTFTLLNATIFASADAINIKSGNTRLRVDNADTGVSLVPGASNIAINPVVSAAVATSATTVEVTLPLASYAVVGSCSNFISVTSSTGSSRTVSSCTLTTPFTVLAVTISGSSLASGDVVNVMVGNSGLGSSALRVGADSTGNLYVPSSTAVSVNPSVASATLTSSTTLEVALSMAGTLSAGADCNAILAIFPNASTTAKSSAITSCSIAASSPSVLTATLATAFAIGDSLNVRNTNAALTAGSLAFTNRTSAVPVLPAFASALATSSKTVVITLPTLSALVAPPSSNPTAVTSLTGSDCANILTVTNGVTSRTISTCTMATSTGATALTVTYTTEGMAAGEVTNTIASPSASLNTLRAGNTTSGTLYTQRSTAVTIHPALQSAVAGGPTTILVSLPMESSFYSAGSNPLAVSTLSASDCADIFVVAAGTTAKTITGCSVAAGPSAVAPSVVTITLASSTPFALSDTVNIASTHPVSGKATLRAFQTASSTTNTVAFLPLSTAITIGASLTSAVAIKSDTIEVNLPVNGYVFANQGTSPTTTALDATQSGTVFDATLAGGVSISTATMASASGATLVTLVLTGGSGYTAGTNKINIKTAATPASSNTGNLRTGATTSSAAFVPSPTTASNLLVLPGIVSAVAASSTRIVATLVINGKLVDSTGIATLTLTGADCSNILQVLPSGSTSAKTLATKDACTMTATSGTTTLTVNLAGGTGNTFAAGDTISILSTHGTDSTKAKLIDTTSSLAFAAGRTAVAISPVLGSITTTTVAPLGQQVVITLPVASKLYDASGNVATNDRLGATACTQILTWTDASNSATSKNLVDVSSVACSLSTDGTKLTVNLATAIAAGDKFTVKSYTAGQAALRAGTSSSGPLYIAGAVTISPSPFTAYATASDTIVVVLPVNSALYAGDNTPVTQLTATQCASVFQVLPSASTTPKAFKTASNPCSMLDATALTPLSGGIGSSTTQLLQITLETGVAYASGDTVSLVSTHGTDSTKASIRAWSSTLAAGAIYAAGSTAITIKPALATAAPLADTIINVTLPVPSVFFGADGGAATASISQAGCQNIISFSGSTAIDSASTPCVMPSTATTSGSYSFNVTLGSSTKYTGANINDKLNIGAQASTQTMLRAGTATTAEAYAAFAAPLYTATTGISIVPNRVWYAVALSSTSIKAKLYVASGLYTSGTTATASGTNSGFVSDSNCQEAVNIKAAGSSTGKSFSASACKCLPNTDVLEVAMAAGATYAAGDTINVLNSAPAGTVLRVYHATASSSLAYTAGAPVVIRPTIKSATVIGLKQLAVQLLVSGSLYTANAPTVPVSALDDCSAIFKVTRTDGAGTPALTAVTVNGCSISADGITVIVNIATNYQSTLMVDINPDHPNTVATNTLRTTSNDVPFAAKSLVGDAMVNVVPTVSYALFATDRLSMSVQLPVPSYIAASNDATTTAGGTVNAGFGDYFTVTGLGISSINQGSATTTSGTTVLSLTTTSSTGTVTIQVGTNSGTATSLRTAGSPFTLYGANASVVTAYDPLKLISAYATSLRTVVVNLPVRSAIFSASSGGSNVTTNPYTSCGTVLTTGSTNKVTSCSLTQPNSTHSLLTVTLNADWAQGDTINIEGTTTDAILKSAGTDTTGAAITATSADYTNGAVTIRPYVVSARAVGVRTVEVVLPIASIVTVDGATKTESLTKTQCDNVLLIAAAYSSVAKVLDSTAACSISTSGATVLTVSLDSAASIAPGDVLNMLPSGTTSGAAALTSYLAADSAASSAANAYHPTLAPIPIAPTIVSAIAITSTRILVTMPFQVSFWTAGGANTTNLNKDDCDTILQVTSTDGATTRALKATDACVAVSGTTFYVNLASDYSDTDVINFKSTHPAASSASLRAGTRLTGTAAAPAAGFGVTIRPTILSAYATSTTSVTVVLPYSSIMYNTGGNTASATLSAANCAAILTLSGPTSPSIAAPGCVMTDTSGQTTIAVTIDAWADSMTININAAHAPAAASYSLRRSGTATTASWYISSPTALKVNPTFQSATLVSPTQVALSLFSTTNRLLNAATPPVAQTGLSGTDCGKILEIKSFDGAAGRDLLANASACTMPGTTSTQATVTVNLASATYASGDTINVVSGHPIAGSPALYTGDSTTANIPYTRLPTGVTIRPAVLSAVAISATQVIISLPTTSVIYDGSSTPAVVTTLSGTGSPTTQLCTDVLAVTPTGSSTAKTLASSTSACVVSDASAGFTTVNVTLDSAAAFTAGDKVNIIATHGDNAAKASLRAKGSNITLSAKYVALATAIMIDPALGTAVATSANTIEVTLPSESSLWTAANSRASVGGTNDRLSGAACTDVLAVTSASGAAKNLSVVVSPTDYTCSSSTTCQFTTNAYACSITSSGSPAVYKLTVTLDGTGGNVFAAGDFIDVKAYAAGKPAMRVGSSNGGDNRVYVPRRVMIAPKWIVSARAVSTKIIHVKLPVAGFLGTNPLNATACAIVVAVTPTGSATAKALDTTSACRVDAADPTLLVVTLGGTDVVEVADSVAILGTNTALKATNADGALFQASSATVSHSLASATLVAADTIWAVFSTSAVLATSASAGGLTTAVCDSVFQFFDASGTAKTVSPISSCSIPSGMPTYVQIKLNSSTSYVTGDKINVKSSGVLLGPSATVAFQPRAAALTIAPALFGASAMLTSPNAVTLRLPATSGLAEGATAAQCNAAVVFTSVAGVTRTSPIASCALASDSTTVSIAMVPSYQYGNGETLNAGASNAVLTYGSATGPAYIPNPTAVPVFSTLSEAVLESYTALRVRLPTASSVPANFSATDCANALVLTSASGTVKNVTFASCALSANRDSLLVTLPSNSTYAAGDKLDVKAGQGELRVQDLGVGSSYVARAVTVTPTFFAAPAVLTAATTVVATLPYASAVGSGSCSAALTLISAAGAPKNNSVASCSLGADKVTLTVTLAASVYAAGDVLNVIPGQTVLTLDGSSVAYTPSLTAPVITPTFVSAALTNATIISVTLPTAAVLTGTAAADCNAAVVITSNGSAVASPLSACAVSTDGLTLTLTAAATYKPMAGDTINVAASQTVLRAGSATGPAYVPRATAVLVTVPSPPPSPPPSPAPSPPPSPPLSTANYSARGLATGPLSCNVLIGTDTVTTTSGNFTGLPSYAGKKASFRVSCKDAVTGAIYTDDTVASTLPAGLTGLILSPVTALASASVSDIKSVADLANTNKDYLRLLGVPVNASAYGSATNLLAYDYYVKGYVALETPAVAVLNVEGMVAANLLMYTKFFDGLNASVAGRDISAAEALAAAQYVMAMGLKMATAPLNTSSPSAILDLLNATYSILTDKNTTAGGRRLMQGSAVSFTQLQAQAAALAAAAADSNALVTVQQQKLIAAINAGTSISAADLTNIITEASKVVVTQSTVIASAATGLGSGAISPASFTSSYTGSALTTLVAQQQLAAPPGTDVTDTPSPPSDSDDKKSNTGLIVGLVVGLVGGAIVITLIVVFIVMRRRKQNVAAAGQAAA